MLSDMQIKRLPKPAKITKLFDVGGLYLLATPQGGKRWLMKYHYGDKEKLLSFGLYPAVSLRDARDKRDAARRLLEEGKDPAIAKAEARRPAVVLDTQSVRFFAEGWLTVRASQWEPRHIARVRASLERDVYPMVGSLGLADLKASDWLAVLREVERRGVNETAHRVLQRVGSIYRYAIVSGAVESSPVTALAGALRPVRTKHFSTVKSVDLPELLRAIAGYQGEAVTVWGLQLALYTFVRSGELRQAEWADVDLHGAHPTWLIPAEKMKMGREHIVPLSRQTVELLRKARQLTGESAYVFPSIGDPKKPMSDNTMLTALYRLGYKGRATVHGFRSTASTLLNEFGWPADAIERQLAHSPADKVRAAYYRSELLPERRRMMQVWADYLDGLRAGVPVSGSPG